MELALARALRVIERGASRMSMPNGSPIAHIYIEHAFRGGSAAGLFGIHPSTQMRVRGPGSSRA